MTEKPDYRDSLAAELANSALEGRFTTEDGKVMLDRRYSMQAVARSAILTPRNADLNLIGPAIVELPADLATAEVELTDYSVITVKSGGRAYVKSELLRRGLPGVNI